MIESTQFLESLQHDNPERPRFAIKRGGYENLEIGFRGQVMCIPMAEVLVFVQRWQADQDSQRAARAGPPTLSICPYPLMNVQLNDPDARSRRWWPEP